MTNYQVQKQHEKCAKIMGLAIQAKTRANKYLVEWNKLRTSNTYQSANSEVIWQAHHKQRMWMKAYERLKSYYARQVMLLVGDEFVSINSLATI
jgi:predicted PolB exonuclease-like 3'-5' exonuclease